MGNYIMHAKSGHPQKSIIDSLSQGSQVFFVSHYFILVYAFHCDCTGTCWTVKPSITVLKNTTSTGRQCSISTLKVTVLVSWHKFACLCSEGLPLVEPDCLRHC